MPKRASYLQLSNAIARKIPAGDLNASAPSDAALARGQGVSRATVRNAREMLRCERRPAAVAPDGTVVSEGLAGAVERARLQLGQKDRVYRLRRVRLAKGGELVAERIVLPAALFPTLAGMPQGAHDIVELARTCGVRLAEARERAYLAAASRWASKSLGLRRSATVLVLDRVVMTQDGRTAEWRIAERTPPMDLGVLPGRRGR